METIIKLERCKNSRIDEVDFNNLGFGKYVTDHMFVADYENNSWKNPCIMPFQNISVAPTMLALHYGQTVFEGMKAFRMKDGRLSVFRIAAHHERFNLSLRRMCMPEVPYVLFQNAIEQLLLTDKDWLKDINGTSLYIRPFMFATEERFGVKVSEKYKFMIFAGAVGDYYSKSLKVKVEEEYVRASKGGTGTAKCGGNYGGAFYPTHVANLQGFDQVIWTTGAPEYLIEESGTMNVMFVIDGILKTPKLSGSILGGITRDSLLKIATHAGIETEESLISAFDLHEKLKSGAVTEAFGTGTAAVTAPIESINIFGSNYILPKNNEIRLKLHQLLHNIRTGKQEDTFDWNYII